MFDKYSFGKLVRKLRLDKGFRVIDLALELGINDAYLGQIERGEKVPSVDVAVLIANYFNIGIEDSNLYGFLFQENNRLDKSDILDKIKMLHYEAELKFIYDTAKLLCEGLEEG